MRQLHEQTLVVTGTPIIDQILELPLETLVVARKQEHGNGVNDVLLRTGIEGWVHTRRTASGPGLGAALDGTYIHEDEVRRWVDLHKGHDFFVIEIGDLA